MTDNTPTSMENDFPFLADDSTVNYIQNSKVMFIMRGLPGSGKSTIASLIKEKYKNSTICSADDFFLAPDGTYHFDADKLPDAHNSCHTRCTSACESGLNVVIIDNTNVRHWEIKFYVELAAQNDYVVVLVMPKTSWRFDPVELATRNKHNVPEDILRAKLEKFDSILPWYWAWFLNEVDSAILMDKARSYFTMCMQNVPKFAEYLKEHHSVPRDETLLFENAYSRSGSSTKTLHCTANFVGGLDSSRPQHLAYSKHPAVMQSIGNWQDIHIIGLHITPRTVGARLALTSAQMSLWAKDDKEGLSESSRLACGGTTVKNRFDLSSVECVLDEILADDTGAGHRKVNEGHATSVEGLFEKLHEAPKFSPISGLGSRAHLTLGWASDSKAVQTGLDQVQLIAMETGRIHDSKHTRVDDAAVRYYGDGQCVVYFDKVLHLNSLFSGKY